jgi:radical SAM superfamily enzyme YgiQ (UPF0313 family)
MDVVIFTCVSGIFFQRSIGAYQLAHFLRAHGYTVQVIDFTDFINEEDLKSLADKFINENTIAVGLSTTFYASKESNSKFINSDLDRYDFLDFPKNVLTAIEYAKEKYPKIKIVAGGAKSETAKNIPYVDAVIHGYAEDKFLDYLNNLKKNLKIIPINKPLNGPLELSHDPSIKQFSIENLNHRFLDTDVILKNETLPLEISRGCIFKCSFCAFPMNGKNKFDYLRDPETIKDELTYNYETFGTTNYYLTDDTFNDSTYKIEQLHKAITSLPFKINFTTYLRLDLLYAHKEQISMLDEMGLASPFFGIESLNQQSASTIGKGMNVDKAKEFLLELYYTHWKERMPITCSFIVGLPYETKDSIYNTYNWIKTTPLSSIFFPLALTNKTFYKSDFNSNYEKFGYDFDEQSGYWKNDNFNYYEATDIAEKFNEELMRKENIPSSWFLMTLLNHGYTLEEAAKIKVKDLSYIRIFKNRERKIKEYRDKLFKINTHIKGIDK